MFNTLITGIVALQAWSVAIPAIVIALIVAILLLSMIRIVKEYERAIVFRLGKLIGVKGPGLIIVIPFIDSVRMVDLRTRVIDVPRQRVLTRDNVEVTVDAVVYYRVFDPEKAVLAVENYHHATALMAMTLLRDVVGQAELDDLLMRREEINKKLTKLLDEITDPWGIKVTAVTVKEVTLPESLLRAIAKQAEAEREKRARIIVAEGELHAAKIMAEAAKIYQERPEALVLRQLQTLVDVAREKNLVVIAPSDLSTSVGLVTALQRALQRRSSSSSTEERVG